MLLPALLAVLAFGAVVASAAQAATAEGPFYKITGTRLLEGKTKEVTSKLKTGDTFRIENEIGVKVECRGESAVKGAKLLGSTGASSSTGEATLEFTECETAYVTRESSCDQDLGTIKTAALKVELGYTDSARTGDIAVVFVPVKGRLFGTLTIPTSGSCEATELPLEGDLAGLIESGHKLVTVGSEPAQSKTLEIHYPGKSEAFFEAGGKLTDTKTVLSDGPDFLPIGGLALEAGGAEWGVFT